MPVEPEAVKLLTAHQIGRSRYAGEGDEGRHVAGSGGGGPASARRQDAAPRPSPRPRVTRGPRSRLAQFPAPLTRLRVRTVLASRAVPRAPTPPTPADRAWLGAQFPAPLTGPARARTAQVAQFPAPPKPPVDRGSWVAGRAVPRAPSYSVLASTSACHGGPPWPLRPWGRLRTSAVQARTGVQGAEPPPGVWGGAPGLSPFNAPHGRAGGRTRRGSGAEPQGSARSTRRTGGWVGKPVGSGAEPQGLNLSTRCTGGWVGRRLGSGAEPQGAEPTNPLHGWVGGWENRGGWGAATGLGRCNPPHGWWVGKRRGGLGRSPRG